MALTAGQQAKMNEAKAYVDKLDVEMRQAPALYSTYGSYLFEVIKTLKTRLNDIERA